MGQSKPTAARIIWLRDDQTLSQQTFSHEATLDYNADSDDVADGTQNATFVENLPHDPLSETIDIVCVPISPTQKRPQLKWVDTGVETALAAELTGTVTSLTVDSSADFVVGDRIKIGAERMKITVIDGVTWTVRRGLYGTSSSLTHAVSAVVDFVDFSIENEDITLTGSTDAVDAPTITGVGVLNGVALNITAPVGATTNLSSYFVYRNTETFVTTASAVYIGQAAAQPGLIGLPDVHNSTYLDWMDASDDMTATYYYRVTSVTRTGAESDPSNEVSAQPLSSGDVPGSAETPDAPTVAVVGVGIGTNGLYQFTVGVDFSSTTGAASVIKTQLQIADTGTSHSVSTGFTSTLSATTDGTDGDRTIARPPVLETVFVRDYGIYDFSARIYNAVADVWSEWSAPVSATTKHGTPDNWEYASQLRIFKSWDPEEVGGGTAYINFREPLTGSRTIWSYEIQMATGASPAAAYPNDTADCTSLKTIGLGGPDLGEETGSGITAGANVMEDQGKSWTIDEWAGKVLYTYTEMFPASGRVGFPHAYEILSNTAETITLTSKYSFEEHLTSDHSELGADDTAKYIIADGWYERGIGQDRYFHKNYQRAEMMWHALAGADNEQFSVKIPCSTPCYIRGRGKNQKGFGVWTYHDGTLDGTTGLSSAVLFSPGLIMLEAIDPDALAAINNAIVGGLQQTAVTDSSYTSGDWLAVLDISSGGTVSGFLDELTAYVEISSLKDSAVDFRVTLNSGTSQTLAFTSSGVDGQYISSGMQNRRVTLGGARFSTSAKVEVRGGVCSAIAGKAIYREDQ